VNFRGSIVVLSCRLATIATIAVAVPAAACLNTFDSNLLVAQQMGDEKEVAKIIAGLEADFKKDPSLEHSNDLSVARVLTHRYDQAIALLRETERSFPGKAIVAANLGTALELNGDDAEAVRWIREGVRRDPSEHKGSEWLHVRILEAKEALAKDPNWLQKNTVLGVDFGTELKPRASGPMPVDENGAPRSFKSVAESIEYQLNERTKFVKPPDPIVADLYAAQGDLEFADGNPADYDNRIAEAADLYRDASKYGAIRADLLNRRFAAVDKIFRGNTQKAAAIRERPTPVTNNSGGDFRRHWVAVAVFLGIIGAWAVRRRGALRKP
jgi:tetratricopeptide (TPR) repeat protein